MRTKILAAAAATTLLSLSFGVATATEGDVRTGADLARACSMPETDAQADGARGFCYGFLSGTAQYHQASSAGKKGKPLFCLPQNGVTRADAAKMFVDWGRANPQYMNEAPVDALARFAAATWPCKKGHK